MPGSKVFRRWQRTVHESAKQCMRHGDRRRQNKLLWVSISEHRLDLIEAEPAHIGKLALFYDDVRCQRLSPAADHQRMRKRPGLARNISDPADFDSGLFLDLPAHGMLDVVARFHEACQRRIELFGKAMLVAEKAPLAARYEHDDGRVRARIGVEGASAAPPPPAAIGCLSLPAASAAAAVDGMPMKDGPGLSCNEKLGAIEDALKRERTQIHEGLKSLQLGFAVGALRWRDVASEYRRSRVIDT